MIDERITFQSSDEQCKVRPRAFMRFTESCNCVINTISGGDCLPVTRCVIFI